MKYLKSILAILVLLVLIVSIQQVSADLIEEGTLTSVEKEVFPENQVIDVNIEFDEGIYEEMLDNATSEEYVMADLTYNGYTISDIAIRPKGNSSLRDVAEVNGDRYSFKIDLDKYIDDQSLYGVTKLNLNNLYSDPSLMAEYIGYEMLDSIDAVASNTSYVSLSINGEYYGLYIAVEEVDKAFLLENYGNADGELYKPDMGIGSDLAYISDNPEDYEGISPQDDDMSTDENFVELVKVIDQIVINGGETEEYNLSDILNVDSFLSYLALSSVTVHMDSYQASMYHNYYLYYNTSTDLFEWISWDLNMIFNGYPGSGLTDLEATEFLLDEPVIGNMTSYPLVEAVFTNDEYVEIYHNYVEELVTGYLSDENIVTTVTETYTLIEPYASIDENAFYTMTEVKKAIFANGDDATELSLLDFISLRNENILEQFSGDAPSTNEGNGNSGSSGMSGMKGGMQEGNMPDNSMMPEEMMTQGTDPSDLGLDGIPDELMEIYESGQFSDEINEYIKNGEIPPMMLLMEALEELGIEISEIQVREMGDMPPMLENTDGEIRDRPQRDMPTGDMPEGDMPEGDMPEGDMPEGDMPEGDIANGDESTEDAVVADRTNKDMPAGDMPTRDENISANMTGETVEKVSTVDTTDIIAIVVSLVLCGGFSFYLIKKKR